MPISQYLSRTWGIWKIGWKGTAVSNGQATAEEIEIMHVLLQAKYDRISVECPIFMETPKVNTKPKG